MPSSYFLIIADASWVGFYVLGTVLSTLKDILQVNL